LGRKGHKDLIKEKITENKKKKIKTYQNILGSNLTKKK